ncbi:MAG: hypothetical protein AAF747_07935 [Planctomycetota bacterium]
MWARVRRIDACKLDGVSFDVLCLRFALADEFVIEFNEDMEGWSELLEAVELRFGVRYLDWFPTVAFPPFDANVTQLWPEMDVPPERRVMWAYQVLSSAGEAGFVEAFESKHRSPPSVRVVDEGDLETMVERLVVSLGLPPTRRWTTFVDRVAKRVAKHRQRTVGAFRGWTEPIADAVARHQLDVSTSVVGFREHDPMHAFEVELRHVIEFEDAFWGDDVWLLEAEGRWALAGVHDCSALLLASGR